uniref:Large ribosomal subunit protein uL3c n=1 Tax=Cryptomonas sp. CCAC 1634B TaxID=2051848 RepID=A0A679CAZ1_9CRYP|nr:ribosomal protein L3 [Cryptomonas sp. CCAC 1634B]
MTLGILGTKLGMTQVFDDGGMAIPVTVIAAGPCTVTHLKTLRSHGYTAVQVGYMSAGKHTLNKSLCGHLLSVGCELLRHLQEYRVQSLDGFSVGSVLSVRSFTPGSRVSVRGITAGKGFSGTVKRHGFTRGPMTHGSKNHREPGSIGQGTTPGRVYPGKRMAGRLGGQHRTVKNLMIMRVDEEHNLLLLKGAVPGKTGNLLNITTC